jgi:uncharacterized protein (UPF0261 family)
MVPMAPAIGYKVAVMHVLLFATCDTKGAEATWLKEQLLELGVAARIVDCGCLGSPVCDVDVTRAEVFEAAGTTHDALLAQNDRGVAVNAAAAGATRLALDVLVRGELAGVLGIGGSAGTTIGTAAMRALPIGLPKLMVSTLASGDVRPYVGGKDIMMLGSVVDIAGVNRVSRKVLGLAASAMAGMVKNATILATASVGTADRPLVAMTMFGVTTPCVEHAKDVLESKGYEVLVFHATGSGGESFEALARSGMLAGVLDITTTELADELVGGTLSAGPSRLTAAGDTGLPQVVSVGATDMVNFGPRAGVPAHFAERQFYEHNANVTLMRTTPEECTRIGEDIGSKLSAASGLSAIVLPALGVSAIDREGGPFDDPAAREALFAAVEASRGDVPCTTLQHHINDPEFAEAAARKLLELMQD